MLASVRQPAAIDTIYRTLKFLLRLLVCALASASSVPPLRNNALAQRNATLCLPVETAICNSNVKPSLTQRLWNAKLANTKWRRLKLMPKYRLFFFANSRRTQRLNPGDQHGRGRELQVRWLSPYRLGKMTAENAYTYLAFTSLASLCSFTVVDELYHSINSYPEIAREGSARRRCVENHSQNPTDCLFCVSSVRGERPVKQLDEMKVECTQHCLSTCNYILGYCYDTARVLGWIMKTAKGGFRGVESF